MGHGKEIWNIYFQIPGQERKSARSNRLNRKDILKDFFRQKK